MKPVQIITSIVYSDINTNGTITLTNDSFKDDVENWNISCTIQVEDDENKGVETESKNLEEMITNFKSSIRKIRELKIVEE